MAEMLMIIFGIWGAVTIGAVTGYVIGFNRGIGWHDELKRKRQPPLNDATF